MASLDIPCYRCGTRLAIQQGPNGLSTDGKIVVNIPAVICDSCADSVLDQVPDPPGLVCVAELTETTAASLMSTREFVDAIGRAAELFTALFPTSVDVARAAAERLHSGGDKQAAYAVLNRAVKQCEDAATLYVEMAAMAGMDGEAAYGLKFLELVPSSTERYHVIKGNLLNGTGDWSAAAAEWQQGIDADPTDFIPWVNLGHYLLWVKGDLPAAEDHYRRACQAFPDVRQFRAFLGDTMFNQGRSVDAMREYEAALAIPDSTPEFEASIRKMIQACHPETTGDDIGQS
jgi:tetratricopeptide (TPR) repeat protein